MDYLLVWFVLLTDGASGYVPPQEVRVFHCGLPGQVIGVHVDRLVNPRVAFFPDPHAAGLHCEEDISVRVSELPIGDYELATTEMGDGSMIPYIGVDPHTSETWVRDGSPMDVQRHLPLRPTNLRLIGAFQ